MTRRRLTWPAALLVALPASIVWAADDIRDIRGPKPVFPLWLWIGAAAATLLLLVIGWLLWRRWSRRPARLRLPFEIALERLEKTRPLMVPSSVREFSIAISDVVRAYIEAQFRVTATHLTTEEFLHGLLAASSRELAAHRDLLARFLEQCDMAKFAGMSLSTPIMEELFETSRDFITETSRAPALPPDGAAPAAAAP